MTQEPKSQFSKLKREHPQEMLPECAYSFAIITEQLAQVSKSQEKITEKIFGNGKPGMDELLSENKRAITNILTALETAARDREESAKLLLDERQHLTARYEQDEKERKATVEKRKDEWRKFWLGIASFVIITLIGSGIAIWQSVATQKLLLSMAGQ